VACSSEKIVFLEGELTGLYHIINMHHIKEIVRYSQLVMPQDANVVGTLFGGQMISWMDIAVSKAAHRILKILPLMLPLQEQLMLQSLRSLFM